jgi:Uma2 family endonuclease
VVATYKGSGEVLVQDPRDVLMIVEVLSPSNCGEAWIEKNRLYAKAGLEWYLLVELDAAGKDPALILWQLDAIRQYREDGRAKCGETLELPEPLGLIDPAQLLKRHP